MGLPTNHSHLHACFRVGRPHARSSSKHYKTTRVQDSVPFLLVVGWHSLLQKRVLRTFVLNTSTMRLDFQYMICFRSDEFAYARAVAKKIPDFLRPCHPRQPLCKAVKWEASPNSVRACFMTGLACTSYAINILFNQIFKTFSFGVGAQQVCIIIFCHCELQPPGP